MMIMRMLEKDVMNSIARTAKKHFLTILMVFQKVQTNALFAVPLAKI